MRVGVVVFPGSNSDHDTRRVFGEVLGQDARFLWHKDSDLHGSDAIVIPGGFSYGDYLRTGAIARFSPVMNSVKAFAEKGGRVLGICNGFQILQEAGMLDGAMLRNRNVKFLSQRVHIRVEATDTAATRGLSAADVMAMPIAHGDGNLYLDDDARRDDGLHREDARERSSAGLVPGLLGLVGDGHERHSRASPGDCQSMAGRQSAQRRRSRAPPASRLGAGTRNAGHT